MALDIPRHQFRHFGAAAPEYRAIPQGFVAAGTGGPVVAGAQPERAGAQGSAAQPGQARYPAAHRPAQVKGIGKTRKKVVIVMLDLGQQECVGNCGTPVFEGEIGGAPLQGGAQNRFGHLQHHQGIGEQIGRGNPAHGHGGSEAHRRVAQAGAGEIRAGGGQLDLVEQGGHLAALQRRRQLFFGGDGPLQYAEGLVEPDLDLGLQGKKAFIGLGGVALPDRKQCRGKAAGAAAVHALNAQVLPGVCRRLDGIGPAKPHALHRHVLMTGQEQIKIQLPGQLAGQILSAGGKQLPGGEVLFKAAMIDAHAHIALGAQPGEGVFGGRECVGDAQMFQVLRLLPHIHMVGHNAGDAHAQAACQGVHRLGAQRQLTLQVHQVCAQAYRVHGKQVMLQRSIAKIEIVVAQGEIVQPQRVEGRRDGMERKSAGVVQIVLQKGGSLQGIAAVQDQGIAVFFDLTGQIQQAGGLGGVGGIIDGENMAVGVGSVVNAESLLHDLPPRQLYANFGGNPFHKKHQHDEPGQNGARLIPAVAVHGEDKGRADAARAHQPQNGGVAEIDVEPVDGCGGKVRHELGQDAVADLLPGGAARGVQGLENPHIQVLDGLDVHFADHTHRAQRHGEQARKGAGPGNPDEHEAVHKSGHGAHRHDDQAAQKGNRPGSQVGSGEKGQGNGENGAHHCAQKGDADGLQQQIGHPLGGEVEEQAGVWMEDAREDIEGDPGTALGGAAGLHRGAAPEQQGDHYEGGAELEHPFAGALGVSAFDSFVHGDSPLHQPFARGAADGLDHKYGYKQGQQDHADAGIFAPADLFVQQKAQAAGTHISQDGGVPHVAFKAEQAVGEVGGQHLGHDGADKGAEFGGAHGFHGLEGAHIHRFDLFIQDLADVGKGENRDGSGARQGAQAEHIGGDEGADQCGQGADDAEQQAHGADHRLAADDVGGGEHGKGHHQQGTDHRAQQRHFDGVEQGLPDLGHIVPLGWDHLAQDHKKFLDAACQHPHVEPGYPDREHRQCQQGQDGKGSARAGLGDLLAVWQDEYPGGEDLVVQVHDGSSCLPW